MPIHLTHKQTLILRTGMTALVIYLIFQYLLPLVLPFLVALLLALLIRPVAQWMCKMLHIPLGICAGIVLVAILAGVGLAGYFLGRLAAEQLVRLGQRLPILWEQARLWVWNGCEELEDALHLADGTIRSPLSRLIENADRTGEAGAVAVDQMTSLAATSFQGAMGLLRGLVSLIVVVFVTIGATLITTTQLESLRQAVDRSLFRQEIRLVTDVLARVGVAYGKTQLVIMACTVVVSGAGLTLLGDPYALLWAAVIGLVDALPIFGAGTILWPWLGIALLRGQWIKAAGLAGIYVVSNLIRQWLEARYMGDRIGISPLENLIAMYVGLQLFGVLGLFLGPIGYLLIKEVN